VTASDTPTASATPTPRPTATDTPTAQPTPLPFPTETPPPASNTPAVTDTPQPTATPTIDLSERQIFLTPLRALPTATPSTPTPPPTLDVTPTFITVEAPAVVEAVSPVPATTTPQDAPTATLEQPTPTLAVNALPTVQIIVPQGFPTALPVPGTRLYTLSTGGGSINISTFDLDLPGFQVELFAQNPANPNQFAVVNGAGQIFFVNDYQNRGIQQLVMDIFTEFTYQVDLIEDNDAAVTRLAWANDGTLAFLIDADKNNKDGVWFWEPLSGFSAQLLRECPPLEGCNTTLDKRGLREWEARDIEWSPDSQALLIRIDIPPENRGGYVVAERFATSPQVVPPVFRFDDARWSTDSQRIIVSGRSPDGRIVFGVIDRDGTNAQLFDMGQFGYTFTRDAVEFNGRVYGFAGRDGEDGALSLVAADGQMLAENLGSQPERIDWSPDNSAALLVFEREGARRYFVVTLPLGAVSEITAQVADALRVEWVRGTPPGAPVPNQPVSQPTPTFAPVEQPAPTAQPPDSRFVVGGTATVVVPSGVNLRTDPSLNAAVLFIAAEGTQVTLINGPLFTEGASWWQVQLPDGNIGWMAEEVNGLRLLE
jgi:hypothetical protein